MEKINGVNVYGMVLIDRDGNPLTAVNMCFQEDDGITEDQLEKSLKMFNEKVRAIVLDQPFNDLLHRLQS